MRNQRRCRSESYISLRLCHIVGSVAIHGARMVNESVNKVTLSYKVNVLNPLLVMLRKETHDELD